MTRVKVVPVRNLLSFLSLQTLTSIIVFMGLSPPLPPSQGFMQDWNRGLGGRAAPSGLNFRQEIFMLPGYEP